MLSTVRRPQPGWNQKVDDVDSAASPPTSQKNVHELITSPNLFLHAVFKNVAQKAFGEFRSFRLWLSWTPCLTPWNKLYTFLHHNPVSADWLYCTWASGSKSGSVTWRQTWDIPHQLVQHIFLKSNLAGPHAPLWRDQKDERFSFLLKLFF